MERPAAQGGGTLRRRCGELPAAGGDQADQKPDARSHDDRLPGIILDEFLGIVASGGGDITKDVGLLMNLVADFADGLGGLGFDGIGLPAQIVTGAHKRYYSGIRSIARDSERATDRPKGERRPPWG